MDKKRASQRGWFLGLVIAFSMLFTCNPILAQQQEWIYITVQGDTLWDLSEKYFPNVSYWKKFKQLNGITYPKKIQPGTRLRVPMAWLSAQAVPAKVVAVNGEAALIPSGTNNKQNLQVGAAIQLGDTLQTGPDASAWVEFADGSVVTIHQETTVLFDHLSVYSDTGMVDTRLRLNNGRVDIRAQPAVGPGSRFEIQTPAAVSAVRGTEYRTAAGGDVDTTWVEVLEGKVAATGKAKTRLVPAEYGTRVVAGKAPLPPKPLLEPPVLNPLPEPVERINWPLIWEPVINAERYHVEVAARSDFFLILWERYTENPRTSIPDLADGTYFVRVRGVDHLGIEGLNRVQQMQLDARPQPPVPLDPADGAVIRGTAPDLRWTDSTEAESYRLQVAAAGGDFTSFLIDQTDISTTSYNPPEQIGTYQWRLASISESGEQGPFSPPRSFEIKPIPPTPTPPTFTADEEKVVASWQAGAEGQTYQVQLAEDREFTNLLLDESLTDAQLEIPQVKGASRYLRVRIVEPDGYLGPWGAVQKIAPLPDNGWLYVLGVMVLGIILL